MANRFWVGDGGNWSDNVTHWSASTGGAPGASLPTSADNVYFDAASFTVGGQTVTVDAAANCLDMDWTGATNTPTLAGGFALNVYGNMTFIASMTINISGQLGIYGVGKTITSSGQVLSSFSQVVLINGSSSTLADAFNIGTKTLYSNAGSLNTANFDVTCGRAVLHNIVGQTFTLGTSVFNCTAWEYPSILTANTATIKVTGTGAFAGGGLTTYYNVNLNGTAHTISGSNTFNTLTLKADTTQTITFTDGTTQIITTPTLSGSSGHVHTLRGSGVDGWNITKASGGYVSADYVSISRSTGSPAYTFRALSHSTNGGNNSGWEFILTARLVGKLAVLDLI